MRYLSAAWAAATVAATAFWVIAALGGGDPSPVATTAAGAAAAAATTALVGAGWRPRTVEGARWAGLVFAGLPPAVAAAVAGRPGPLAAVLGVAAATVRAFRAGRGGGRDRTGVAVAAGCGLVSAAIVVERVTLARWALPGDDRTALILALIGSALVVAGASLGPSRAWALAVPALVIAMAAAEHVPEATGVTGACVAAVAAAFVAGRRPCGALAALAVAAAMSGSTTSAAAGLLAAAAVLTLVIEHPAAALLAVPGGAALATAVVPSGRNGTALTLSVGALAVAAILARHATAGSRPVPLVVPLESLPALVLGAWLLLAPGSWSWVGTARLEEYDRGAAVAAAAGGIALLATRVAAMRPGAPQADVVRPRHRRRSRPRHRRRSSAVAPAEAEG